MEFETVTQWTAEKKNEKTDMGKSRKQLSSGMCFLQAIQFMGPIHVTLLSKLLDFSPEKSVKLLSGTLLVL